MRATRLRTTRARARGWSSPGARLALLAGLAVSLLAFAVGAAPARADQTDQQGDGPGGYTVQVAVRFSGNAAPGGGGGSTRTVSVHPSCWWEPATGPYTDAAAMLDWYDGVTGGLQTRGVIDQYGPRSAWEDAAKAEADGDDLSWYRVFCKNPKDYAKYNTGVVEGGIDPITGTPVGWVTFNYRAIPVGTPLPAPMVSPEELARVAHDAMEIPVPVVDRNPKLAGPGAPTLVGLPTWFWVTDDASVGGAVGRREIRADLGDVWAEVTATTGGLRLSSPAGGTTCVPQQAIVEYGSKVAASSGCTIEFSRASTAYPGGYPVSATTDWNATWEGSENDGVHTDLDQLQRQATVNVPVAEVQNVVTR